MKNFLLLLFVFSSHLLFAQADSVKTVCVLEIKSEIDPRTARYLELGLQYATDTKADIVVLELDTFGGTLKDAKDMTDRLLQFAKPVWVYINTDAASAGALISIACDSIYMHAGANIGAATVVNENAEAAPDKYQSYMRSIMRSTAEVNHRDPRIAEAMVDQTLQLDSIKKDGKVITFTTTEAIRWGYCDGQVSSIEDMLKKNKIEHYELKKFSLSVADKIIDFFINPFISGFLLLVIIGGIYFELQSPGIGFPLFAAITALVLYLVPYYLNGLAENWEILVLLIGILLLLAEIFVIPGFGVAGISGIVLVFFGLLVVMLNNDFFDFQAVPVTQIVRSGLVVSLGFIGSIVLIVWGSTRITKLKSMQNIILQDAQAHGEGYSVGGQNKQLIGQRGVAHTILRPSGKIKIDDNVYDALSLGEIIEAGKSVEVMDVSGATVKVKEV